MRLFFNICAAAFFACAVAFAVGGVWVIVGGMPAAGMLIVVSAGFCGFLGEGCRGAARREAKP